MTNEQLSKKVEETLARNRAAIKRARSRAQNLDLAAELSDQILDRAFRQLRQGKRL
jgi:uncharacterized protein with von Willebrand factor type A (vWA) domain